jgi:23S rRNA (guanosine2251-2'-O)-methyltransferase
MGGKVTELVVGRNPVYEVFQARRRRIFKLMLAQGLEPHTRLEHVVDQAQSDGIVVERLPRRVLDRHSSHHQGVVAEVEPYPYVDLDDILARARKDQGAPLILMLDALQDPQNFGTLLRTAEAVGVNGVVIPHRRRAGVTPAVVSASSGACEHLFICTMNLVQAIRKLKEEGLWVVGVEKHTDARHIDQVELGGPLALVIGSEGQGLRRLVRETCDFLAQLPMRGRVESLNAAVAGSIALYMAWEARRFEPSSESEV